MLKQFVMILAVGGLLMFPMKCLGSSYLDKLDLANVLQQQTPDWMESQIVSDLSYFQDKTLSLSKLHQFYLQEGKRLQLAKFTICNNNLTVEKQFLLDSMNGERVERYCRAITKLCQTVALPNTVMLISTQDGLNEKGAMPIFAMCKIDSDRIILLPDYESLGERYQVLKKVDITTKDFEWDKKIPQMIWRGSTAQLWTRLTEKHVPLLSRVTLCELSQRYPDLIDAKFTIYAQGGENIPYLQKFKGNYLSFEEEFAYKYHILIDGNTCPYSTSGWKLFGNSLLFKPDSGWFQWYYPAMQPYVHYIPVKKNLSDLVQALQWAMEHDEEAKNIAANCRDFARTHITIAEDLVYLYQTILRYSQLHFVH